MVLFLLPMSMPFFERRCYHVPAPIPTHFARRESALLFNFSSCVYSPYIP
nr:MAG TPA: hypothetical protein [Caudoviricetes sp.]